jgi:phosphoribosylformylglycinamidine synthase
LYQGEIMSLGERAPLALCDASAAARMTIGEALTNMLGGYVQDISHISLSAISNSVVITPPSLRS